MKKQHFEITINAPKQKVYDVMLADKTYREWTSPFMEGGFYKGSWDKGSKMLFLAPSKNGGDEGMVATIEENRPNEFVSIKHLGFFKDGVEDTTSDEVKEWAGAHENYTFEEVNGDTKLSVDIGVADSYEDMFNNMWPEALQKLKQLVEK